MVAWVGWEGWAPSLLQPLQTGCLAGGLELEVKSACAAGLASQHGQGCSCAQQANEQTGGQKRAELLNIRQPQVQALAGGVGAQPAGWQLVRRRQQ